jgi:hypothetical protein
MTDLPDKGRAAFTYAWNRLMQAGFTAISPHFLENAIDIETRAHKSKEEVYRYALPIDLFALSSCDAIMVLPGWADSDGTNFELHGARLMGIPIIRPDALIPHLSDTLSLEKWIDRAVVYLQTEANLCPTMSS